MDRPVGRNRCYSQRREAVKPILAGTFIPLLVIRRVKYTAECIFDEVVEIFLTSGFIVDGVAWALSTAYKLGHSGRSLEASSTNHHHLKQ